MTGTSIHHPIPMDSQNIGSALGGKSRDGLAPPPTLLHGEFPLDIMTMNQESRGSPTPEDVTSTNVPNPFGINSVKNLVKSTEMTAVNWSSPQYERSSFNVPTQVISGSISVPNPFQSSKPEAVVPSAGICSANSEEAGSPKAAPSSLGHDNSVLKQGKGNSKTATSPTNRRQKRLERNRESARLSRRRRKQYLEILEEKVKNLSVEMDIGRRSQVAVAVDTVKEKKRHALASTDPSGIKSVQSQLNSTSLELRVAGTFVSQQIKSMSMPPHIKFLLWLSLQNDSFFRGGRAASERLSAARIGERMLSSGNCKVPPAHGMWPLFCNEVGLSYDQEEKVRQFQRNLVASDESWLERHTASSSLHLANSIDDCHQSISHCIGQRQSSILKCLDDEQKKKFLSWADKNTERIAAATASEKIEGEPENCGGLKIEEKNHDAANMYILNDRVQTILSGLYRPAPLVDERTLKRFGRRPSFESLGSSLGQDKKDGDSSLSLEGSFPSSGSLKRSASMLSDMDEEDRPQISCVPEEAEKAAKATVDSVLGFVKDIIPKPRALPVAPTTCNQSFTMPPPPNKDLVNAQAQGTLPNTAAPLNPTGVLQILPSHIMSQVQPMSQAPALIPACNPCHTAPQAQQTYESHQIPQIPAFLPPQLNVVPEEGFLSNNVAEDFLFDLAEEDWAIGEGFEMDT
mmetsp:Transcript_27873/g.41136  ORF Transcript_27873/g.41136 Transcript_27873/m.41136 type:complete len:687 (-) Transcript_27873:431-2491(-)